MTTSEEVYARLARQSLGRPLDPAEDALAEALESIFRTGCHDFEMVAAELNVSGVARPSGEGGGWTPEVLQAELAKINASLDQAYLRRGSVERI